MLKIDIQKAFDSITWSSIIAILSRMNFPKLMLAWIYTCISTTHFSILRNGCSRGFFKGTQWVRQGDPISAYMFIVVMEVLNSLIIEQVKAKR